MRRLSGAQWIINRPRTAATCAARRKEDYWRKSTPARTRHTLPPFDIFIPGAMCPPRARTHPRRRTLHEGLRFFPPGSARCLGTGPIANRTVSNCWTWITAFIYSVPPAPARRRPAWNQDASGPTPSAGLCSYTCAHCAAFGGHWGPEIFDGTVIYSSGTAWRKWIWWFRWLFDSVS